jgi:hypothetical protein
MIDNVETPTKRNVLILRAARLAEQNQLDAKNSPFILPGPFDCGGALVDINDREALAKALGDNDFVLYR